MWAIVADDVSKSNQHIDSMSPVYRECYLVVNICMRLNFLPLFVGTTTKTCGYDPWGRILVQFTIYRRLLIGRDGHLDQSEAYDIS